MGSRLINVRLDDDRSRKAKALQSNGLSLSDLVRQTIDERYAQIKSGTDVDPAEILNQLDAAFPLMGKDFPPSGVNVHDRKSAGAAMRRHLKRRKS